jgi:hypothetical protein
MTKIFILSLFLLGVACDDFNSCRQQQRVVDNKILVGRTEAYTIYARKVDGGTLYEYYYNGMTYMQKARGFRVVFIPDSGATVTQAPFGLE